MSDSTHFCANDLRVNDELKQLCHLMHFSLDPGMPVFTETESPQATEQQQFRSEIPQENTSSDVPDISGQALQQSAPVFPQYTPQSDNFMQIPMDDVAASMS